MTRSSGATRRRTPLLLAGGLLLTGCAASEVDADELAPEVARQLQEQADLALTSSTCDGPLPAETGATVRCEGATEGGSRYGVLVRATGVDDDTVAFEAEVDRRLAIGPDELEPELVGELERQVGAAPESVACDDPLPAEVDAEVRCVLTAPDGTRLGMTVTTTAVEGTDVRFGIRVDDDPLD